MQSRTDHPSIYYYTGLSKKVKKNEAEFGIYLGFLQRGRNQAMSLTNGDMRP